MIERKMIRFWAAAATLLGAAGCSAGLATNGGAIQNIEFTRGCWIERKNDAEVTMLRLLPEGGPEGNLTGYLQIFVDGKLDYSRRYTLARDGSYLTVDYSTSTETYRHAPDQRSPAQDGSSGWRAYFLKDNSQGRKTWVVFEGNAEHLQIYNAMGPVPGRFPGYDFGRDGCD